MNRRAALSKLALSSALAGLAVLGTACETVENLSKASDDPTRQATVEIRSVDGEPETIVVTPSRNKSCRAGIAKMRTQSWSEAIALLEIAVTEDPEDERALFALGLAYEAKGDMDSARASYKRALELESQPDYERAWERINEKLEWG